ADTTHTDGRAEAAAFGLSAVGEPVNGVEPLLPEEVTRKSERDVLTRIARQATRRAQVDSRTMGAAGYGTRVLPLPRPLREFITRRITKLFLKDVNEFLFVEERREAMCRSLLSRLEA